MAERAHITLPVQEKTHRRGMLFGAVLLPTSVALAAPVTANPDAELIALCARHPALIAAFNTSDGDSSNNDPTWAAYAASRDAISDAVPQTFAGLRAKALVAKAEALSPDGSEQPSSTMAEPWSWDLVNDLLRLTGSAA